MPQMMPIDIQNNLKYSFKAIFKEPLVGDNLSAGIWRHIGCIFKFGEKQTQFGKGDFHREWTYCSKFLPITETRSF